MLDVTIAEQILAIGVGLGFGVVALTQQLKKWVEAIFNRGWKYLGQTISMIVSGGSVALYLKVVGWGWWSFVGYTLLVWMLANGYFKVKKSSAIFEKDQRGG